MKRKTIKTLDSRVAEIVWMTVCLLLISSAANAQDIADFSGKWDLNKLKSSSLPASITSSSITISQEKKYALTLDISVTSGDSKPFKKTENYFLNSSVEIKKVNQDDKSIRIDCTALPDGHSFSVTETTSLVENGTTKNYIRVSVYSLSIDGKTLIIKTDDTQPEGSPASENEMHEKRVYDKSV